MKHDQYVLPNNDTWMVMDDTGIENVHYFRSMMNAIRYAQALAKRHHAEVTVCKNDPNALDAARYADDPDQP